MVWEPDANTIANANATKLMHEAGVDSWKALHAWSATHREDYWRIAARELGFGDHARVLDLEDGVEQPRWFPEAKWNAAAACFQEASKTAIIAGGEDDLLRRVSYGELRSMANQVSLGLARLGLSEGDAVALYMPMNVECVAAYLGIVQAGLAVVSIPDSFTPPEVATRLRLGQADAVITVATFRRGGKDVPMLPKAQEATDQPCIVIGDGLLRDQDIAWDDFLVEGDYTAPSLEPSHVSNILFSSGTTGEPKAIPWTHLTPLKAAADGRYHQDIHPDDVVAWPTNIGWMMGPWLIYATFLNGATMALYEGAPGPDFVDFANQAGVTVLGVVPAIVRAWRAAGVPPASLHAVRVFSSTGEASNADDYAYLMSLAAQGAPVIEYCGGTEIGGGHITGSVLQAQRPATFTTPALGLDFVVLDDGHPVQQGIGELYIVPPSVGLSQRLLNRDHHAEYYAGVPQGPDGQVLRRHGDEIMVLSDGWAAAGRADDTMNLGGIKVGSVELERVMDGHPDVKETAAVAVRPKDGGADQLVVFAVSQASSDALKPALQDRIKKQLNPLFRIHDVVVVESLPRTASNKVMRRELRKAYK